MVKVGNLDSLRTWADVRDAVRAYYMLVTVKPTPGAYYNIGGQYTCSVRDMLDTLIGQSTCADIKVELDPERLRPIDADLQVPDTTKFRTHTGWAPRFRSRPRCATCSNIGASACGATRTSSPDEP